MTVTGSRNEMLHNEVLQAVSSGWQVDWQGEHQSEMYKQEDVQARENWNSWMDPCHSDTEHGTAL